VNDSLWSAVVENLKNQIALSGEAICHCGVMQQVLRERIIGEVTEVKYAAALATFATEMKANARLEKTENGVVFIFSPAGGAQ
jgi:hypothetical protein